MHWLWLAALPLVLWLFRRQARRVPVSTLLFFRSLAKEHQESAWLRQIKRWLSLLLTLLVITAEAVALSVPGFSGSNNQDASLVVLLDRSASMAAVQDGRTRLDEAKELIHRRVQSLPDSTIISLVLYADTVEVPVSRSRNKREVLRHLGEVTPLPVEDRLDVAWEAASRLAQVDSPSIILHVGDKALPASIPMNPEIRYERGPVEASEIVNVGITGFDLRAAPLERHKYGAFLRIGASQSNARTVTTSVEVKLAGRLIQLRELELKPGEETRLSLDFEGPGGELLEIRASTSGDQFGLDDVLLIPLPVAKPLVVAWISAEPDPFTDLALGAMVEAGRIEVLKGSPTGWPLTTKPDVYVFENWFPENWSPNGPVLLLTPNNAPGTLPFKPLERGIPVDRIRTVNADHALLHGISTYRLSITQTTKLTAGEGLEALWMTANEPLLLAGENSGHRMVVTGFSPARSEQLALLPAFPLLLGNAIQWCAGEAGASAQGTPSRPGRVIELSGELRWSTWDGRNVSTRVTSAKGGLAALSELGAWEAADGSRGATALTSLQETNLPARTNAQQLEKTTSHRWWGASITTTLLALILGLLLLESWLCHRRAVY